MVLVQCGEVEVEVEARGEGGNNRIQFRGVRVEAEFRPSLVVEGHG